MIIMIMTLWHRPRSLDRLLADVLEHSNISTSNIN